MDAAEHTVIMVQVENEIGMLSEAREYTAAANLAFSEKVPDALMSEFSTPMRENTSTASGIQAGE
jgi:hypothetical protein